MQVLEARWRLFGHAIRRDRNIPANKAMLFYFSENKRARGRPQTTLPITLNNDLKKLVATKLELTTQTDLDTLRLSHSRRSTKMECPRRRDKENSRRCKIR
ncbi:hypothetical protein PoB_002060400 [Plakobranchus ocellatus]|uniref:Uncharacterized protein n=1 Tax=Plakobranchus ocellatus TaxID=259542 RepID=A0AAV3ZI70_9GAST|nr:hypothetical protein PoB_002060400 [Plakobranchus ocellatus]